MYKRHNGQISLYENPAFFGGIPLNPENEWVKLVAILPWDQIEERYAASFAGSTVGQPADSARIAVGSQIIKNWYGFSDERVTEEIAMNPYLCHGSDDESANEAQASFVPIFGNHIF